MDRYVPCYSHAIHHMIFTARYALSTPSPHVCALVIHQLGVLAGTNRTWATILYTGLCDQCLTFRQKMFRYFIRRMTVTASPIAVFTLTIVPLYVVSQWKFFEIRSQFLSERNDLGHYFPSPLHPPLNSIPVSPLPLLTSCHHRVTSLSDPAPRCLCAL